MAQNVLTTLLMDASYASINTHLNVTFDNYLLDVQFCYFRFMNVQGVIRKSKTNIRWVKVFHNGPSKICGREPLKNW